MDAHPAESSAATADKPGTPSPGAFRGIALVFLILAQVYFVWSFVGHWQANLGPRLDGVAAPVWVSVISAALVVGAVVVEAVLLLRRRRDPLQVVSAAYAATLLAWLCETALGG
jgi:hypothetical protein